MPTYPNPYQEQNFLNYLNRANPYAPQTTLFGSPNTAVAKTYADLSAGQDWITAQRNNAMAAIGGAPIYRPGAAWNPATGKASPWGAPPIAPGQPSPAVAGQEPNPFSVVSNPKNTQITSLLDKVLAQSGASMDADMNKNPYTVYGSTKDQAQASDINAARSRVNASNANTQQQLADFTRDYLGGNAQARDYANQEASSIGGYYNGSVQSDLDRLARERELAVARSTERALDRARGSLNSQRFLSGDSSRLQSQYLNTLTDTLANEARQQADLNRANYLTVRGGADANAGRRQQLLDQSLGRGLVPLNAAYAQSAAELSQLGALGNLTGQNTVYNMDTPESRLQRQLGVLGTASGIDQANTFYSLRRPYEPDLSGNVYRSPRGGTGGGYPVAPMPGDPFGNYEPDFSGDLAYDRSQAPRTAVPRQSYPPRPPSMYANADYNYYPVQGGYELNDPNSMFPYSNATLPGGQANPMYYPGFDPFQYLVDQERYE